MSQEKSFDNYVLNKLFKSNGIKKRVDILNVGGGKFNPLTLKYKNEMSGTLGTIYTPYLLVNLDKMYLDPDDIEHVINNMFRFPDTQPRYSNTYYINYEIFDFLTRFQYQFDLITIYRFLEHVRKVDVLYFIYLLSTTVKVGGLIDVIVPDYKHLARRILIEDPYDKDFEATDIINTFELLNEPYDPHGSIWTKERAYRFFELEGRFEIQQIQENYYFDGRDIYLRFIAKRIK